MRRLLRFVCITSATARELALTLGSPTRVDIFVTGASRDPGSERILDSQVDGGAGRSKCFGAD